MAPDDSRTAGALAAAPTANAQDFPSSSGGSFIARVIKFVLGVATPFVQSIIDDGLPALLPILPTRTCFLEACNTLKQLVENYICSKRDCRGATPFSLSMDVNFSTGGNGLAPALADHGVLPTGPTGATRMK